MLPSRALLALALLGAPGAAQVDFPPAVTTLSGPAGLADLALADVDGDGDLDLLTSDRLLGRVELRLGDGLGGFGAPTLAAAVATAGGLAVGHLDGGAALDLAVINETAGRVRLFRGDGAGAFTSLGLVTVSGQPTTLALGDLDADGLDDLFVGEAAQPRLTVARNAGAGSFPAALVVPLVEDAGNIALGDVDGNGTLDACLSVGQLTTSHDGTTVLLGPGPTLLGTQPIGNEVGGEVGWVELGDLDEDGVLDLVLIDREFGGHEVVARRGAGDGTFAQTLWYELSSDFTDRLALGDCNGDGHLDLVAAMAEGDVQRYAGTGTGALWGGDKTAIGPSSQMAVPRVLVGDLDGDGVEDALVGDATTATLTVLLSRPEEVSGHNDLLWLFQWQHHLALQLGPAWAGRPYLVVGSATGTSPATLVDGLPVPLVVDPYTLYTVATAGVWLQGGLGVLGAAGEAGATLTADLSVQALVQSLPLHHAFLVFDPAAGSLAYASAPVTVVVN